MGDDRPLAPWSSAKTWMIPIHPAVITAQLEWAGAGLHRSRVEAHGWNHLPLQDTVLVFQGRGAEDHGWRLKHQKSSQSKVRVSVAMFPAMALGPFLPPLASGPPGVPGSRLHRPT